MFSLVPRNKSSPGFTICSAVLLLRYQADASAHIHLLTFLYCTSLEITYLRVKQDSSRIATFKLEY